MRCPDRIKHLVRKTDYVKPDSGKLVVGVFYLLDGSITEEYVRLATPSHVWFCEATGTSLPPPKYWRDLTTEEEFAHKAGLNG